MIIILVILYFLIAVSVAIMFTYYTNDGETIPYVAVMSLLWPLDMVFVILGIIFIKDLREYLNKQYKK